MASTRFAITYFVGLGALTSAIGCNCGETQSFTKVHAQIFVQPAKLDFGEVLLGTSGAQQVTIKNLGEDVLRVCLPNTTAPECTDNTHVVPEDSPFKTLIDHPAADGSWIVDKSSSRKFIVSFTPDKEGPAAATLSIGHTGINGPTTLIKMTGSAVGPHVDLSPRALDFGEVTVGARKELDLTFTNHTQFTTPASITLDMQSSFDFGTLDDQGMENPANMTARFDVPGNGTLDVKVFFRPTDEGQKTLSLSAAFCAGCDKQTVTLTGVGTKPMFSLSPPAIDFGQVETGNQVERSFVVKNVGNTKLTVLSLDRDPNTPKDFTATAQAMLPKTLNAGEQLAVTVDYTAIKAGNVNGRILVLTNAWDDAAMHTSSPIGSVGLSAVSAGPNITAVPTQVSFGTVPTGMNATQNLVISNSGTAPLDVSAIQLMTNTPALSMTNIPALPLTIMPGDSITAALHFSPTTSVMLDAKVVITSSDRSNGMLTVPVQGIGALPNTCTISLAPSARTFGVVDPGRTVTLGVQIQSVGSQPCVLSNFSIQGAQEFSFAQGTPPTMTTLDPNGGTLRLQIAYAPTAQGMHSAQLQFTTNDPSLPMAAIPLSGSSSPSALKAMPSALDFSIVPTSCRSPNRSVTLLNTGSSPVTVSQVALDPSTPPSFLLGLYNTPTTIPAGQFSVVTMRYAPTHDGVETGVLFVNHSASSQPIAVPVSGEGRSNPAVTDTFSQAVSPTDVLFVMDNSCSMTPEQNLIQQNLGAFFAFAQGATLDFQVAVTTTDYSPTGEQGAFVGPVPIITPLTINGDQLFSQAMQRGIYGSPMSSALQGAYLALQMALQGTAPNAGFLRPNARLAVVIISDDEDQGPLSIQAYEDFFRSIKGAQHPDMLSVNGIVGVQYPPDCMGPNGILGSYSPRYVRTIQDTGGIAWDICDSNWAMALQVLGARSFGLKTKFPLSSTPVASSISVTVDGQQVSSSVWSYNAADNTVNFPQTATPGANSQINISYTLNCL